MLVGNSNTLGNGKNDLWIVRLDQNLKFQWQRYFGGAEDDFGKDIIFSNNSFIILAEKNEQNKKKTWLLIFNHSCSLFLGAHLLAWVDLIIRVCWDWWGSEWHRIDLSLHNLDFELASTDVDVAIPVCDRETRKKSRSST